MKKKNILLLIVFIWLGVIFVFSGQNSFDSNGKSKETIKYAIKLVYKIKNKEISEEELNNKVAKLNKLLRKVVHMFEYFILTLLILITLKLFDVKNKELYMYSIFFCFTAACWDEIHQLYVPGRTGQFIDVLIDTSGGIIFLLCHSIKEKLFKNKKKTS